MSALRHLTLWFHTTGVVWDHWARPPLLSTVSCLEMEPPTQQNCGQFCKLIENLLDTIPDYLGILLLYSSPGWGPEATGGRQTEVSKTWLHWVIQCQMGCSHLASQLYQTAEVALHIVGCWCWLGLAAQPELWTRQSAPMSSWVLRQRSPNWAFQEGQEN